MTERLPTLDRSDG